MQPFARRTHLSFPLMMNRTLKETPHPDPLSLGRGEGGSSADGLSLSSTLKLRQTVAVGFLTTVLCALASPARADLWTTAYYPGWEQANLPPSAIDFTVVTHVIHFSLIPNSDGSLNSSGNGITPAYSTSIVSAAHGAGRKALICVGGADSESGFQGATTSGNLGKFLNNLTNFMATYSYDGIDLDWEPLPAADFNQFTNLNGLRTALNRFPSHKLLTVAAGAYPSYGDPPASEYVMFAGIQNQFDQISVMTYDLSGPYSGWVTWFNSPIYDGGYRFPSTGGLVPSVDGAISGFITNGVASGKLAVGVAFYGDLWSGGAGTSTGGAALPRQSWTTAPGMIQVAYYDILGTYYQSNRYHWDDSAQAAYLSNDQPGSTNDQFLSYDDAHTCQAKVSYARNRLLGGLMIWELAQAYFPSKPAGQRDPLLQTIKQALATPYLTGVQHTNQDILLNFSALPLGNYRVLWTSNAAGPAWTTLTSNVPGTTGAVQVVDPAVIGTQPRRFYRVKTPP
jgi:chitinase